MSSLEQSAGRGLFARIWGILTRTEEEWEIIDGERTSIARLIFGYACLLALIRPLAEIPQNVMMIHWTAAPTIEITLMRYVASVFEAFLVGLIINGLAPTYHGEKNLVQAMKLSVYSFTPGWIVGLIYIIPVPGFLAAIAALYGLYILCLGIPTIMKSAKDETVGYFVGVAFSAIVISIIFDRVIALVAIYLLHGAPLNASAAYGG